MHTYARHMHDICTTYAQIHTLSTRYPCKVNLYVSACIWLYMYVSVLYVLGGAYLYVYVFMSMYLHVSCAYINTCISVFNNAYVQNSYICMYHVCILYVCVFLHVSGMYHVCASMCMYGMYWPKQTLLPTQLGEMTCFRARITQAPLRASMSRCPSALFRHPGQLVRPDLAHCRAQHASRGSNSGAGCHQQASLVH